MKKKNINTIAIVRLSALGDIVNSAVILQFITKEFPDAKISWITEEVFSPLLIDHPLIDTVHTINLKQIKKEKNLSLLKSNISSLRALDEFDIIIDIQGLLKSAVIARIIGKNTHGFDASSSRESLSSFFYKTTSNISYDENIVKRNCFVASDGLGFKIDDEMILNKKPIFSPLKSKHIDKAKTNIALVIGASWESKKFPKESVLELCNGLKENCIIIWGDSIEREVGEWIVQHSEYATLAPKLSLVELVSLISDVDLLIGNDTGPTHMAWAQNIASITLFGPTTTRMIYETPKNIGIKSPSDVDIYKIDKNDFSINEIEVSKIIKEARKLLTHEV